MPNRNPKRIVYARVGPSQIRLFVSNADGTAERPLLDSDSLDRILGVAPSGYYEWFLQPISNRGQEDARLLRLIRASFVASQGIYVAPRVFLDLREAGETCSKHRVARLMREANLRALHGYRTRRWAVGKPSVAWRRFCRSNRLEPSMSRKGNCWDSGTYHIPINMLQR